MTLNEYHFHVQEPDGDWVVERSHGSTPELAKLSLIDRLMGTRCRVGELLARIEADPKETPARKAVQDGSTFYFLDDDGSVEHSVTAPRQVWEIFGVHDGLNTEAACRAWFEEQYPNVTIEVAD